MSWNDAYKYVRGVAAKHGVESANQPAQVDVGLPMGARIGGLITLQKSPFIRAECDGSLITIPADGDTVIRAISRVNLNISGQLYRYFLHTGDDDSQEKYLQVLRDARGEISEILYCTQLTRIIPETEDDQDAFMGLSGSGLGDKSYTLWRNQICELGATAVDIDVVFGDSDRIEYRRDAGDPEQDFVEPFTGIETRVDDANGEHGLEQKLYFTPYVRELGGSREYLLITTEIVKSRDGDTSRRSIHVDFMIGIPLEPTRVLIQ
ncbi:MAG TPA: DUF2491 family protein [Burkholderiaceae bacterium]|nr:DUF2491 family protein [Burkholderiaceae bacterium]